jgi:tetratricopeptide (TPR) repeat protein
VGPKLRWVLKFVFLLFSLLVINSLYLSAITWLEWLTGKSLQDQTYLVMFLIHLLLGLLLIIPLIVYGFIHMGNTKHRRNKRAIKAGYALFFFSVILLISGLLLTRGIPFLEVKNTQVRQLTYWLHVILPLIAMWLFIMHRLAGPKLSWRASKLTLILTIVILAFMGWLQKDTFYPKSIHHDEINPLYAPSFAQTSDNLHIAPKDLDNNEYCKNCHADVHEGWMNSVHKVSSFNNQSYSFAVNNTREFLQKRDGNHNAAKLCAVCHDPVILFSGEFDKDKDFTDTNIGQAGITCTTCHAISKINSIKGNGAYTLTIPEQYPFTRSELPFLQWVNQTLVKAKPDFHKSSYLKPLHKTAEFCSVCHKVALPKALNHYKWLRGQDHYDSFFLSGVSGHAVASFYYPPKAKEKCADCHMPMQDSDDFGAVTASLTGEGQVHSHYFEAANSGIRYLNKLKPDPINALMQGSLSIDIFGIKQQGELTGELIAPMIDIPVELRAGNRYLIESVIRTLKLGHAFTQGTADSNQVWVEFNVYHNGKLIGMSGGVNKQGEVDDWSYFINSWVLDKNGNRIDKRNGEDIFTALYNHGIPPGAASVVHYALDIPPELTGEITLEAQVLYRKFDSTYYRYFTGDKDKFNDLPILILAQDKKYIRIKSEADVQVNQTPAVGDWKRWNDYGIGLLRQKAFKQAEAAFLMVAELGRAEGWINLTRTYLQQGRLDEAQQSLKKAAANKTFRYTWQLAYFAGVIDLQNGFIDKAIQNFSRVYRSEFKKAQEANFDFSKDYRFVTMYAQTVFQQSKLLSGEQQKQSYQQALALFNQVLLMNPEWADAHFGLFQLYAALGDLEKAQYHKKLHNKYKVDDNAHDSVIAIARANNKAADHAAEIIAIYELNQIDNFSPVNQFIKNNSIESQ